MSSPAPRHESAPWRRLAHWGALQGPQGFVRLAPTAIGAGFALALPDVRRRVIANLRRVLGPRNPLWEQRDAVATLGNYAACFAEAIASERKDFTPRVQVHGEEHLRAALAQGGVVLVTAHIGPWELTARLLRSAHAADVMVVMQSERDAAAQEFETAERARRGLNVLQVGKHATDALPLLGLLKGGGVAAMQLDRLPPNGRVLRTQLFGQPFSVPEGPFRLASLSGARVVPVFARRLGFFDYEVCLEQAIALERRPSVGALENAAQLAVSAMQSFVRRCPTQWFHFSE